MNHRDALSFKVGDIVIEAISNGPSNGTTFNGKHQTTEIVSSSSGVVTTETGNQYDAFTGGRYPQTGVYRSIRNA